MKKIKTLKKNYEFNYIMNNGKFYRGKLITVYLVENNKDHNVFGIAVSSHAMNAVKRNHIKRLIRESYRNNKKEYNVKNGYNIVFLWNKNADTSVSYKDLKNDMENIFTKLGII